MLFISLGTKLCAWQIKKIWWRGPKCLWLLSTDCTIKLVLMSYKSCTLSLLQININYFFAIRHVVWDTRYTHIHHKHIRHRFGENFNPIRHSRDMHCTYANADAKLSVGVTPPVFERECIYIWNNTRSKLQNVFFSKYLQLPINCVS